MFPEFASHNLFLQIVTTPTAPLATDLLVVIVESIWGFAPFNFHSSKDTYGVKEK